MLLLQLRWYSFKYTLNSLLWFLLGNGIIEGGSLFSCEFFFSFIHANGPLVVKKKTMLCVQHIILVLFLDTRDDYIPHLPYHWPEVIGLGSGQWKWGKVMHTLVGLPINPCRIYHSNSSSSRASLRIQSWHCHKMGKSGFLGTFLPHWSNDENDKSPAVRNHWDVGIVTAVHLSYYDYQ